MKKIWKKFKHWCCKVGLCNFNKCGCDCHETPKGRSKAYYPTIKQERAKTKQKKVLAQGILKASKETKPLSLAGKEQQRIKKALNIKPEKN